MYRTLLLGCAGPASANFVDAVNQVEHAYTFVGVDINPYMLALSPLEKKYHVDKSKIKSYTSFLNEIIEKENIDFIHPQPDAEVEDLLYNIDEIDPSVKTFLPTYDVVTTCQDKFRTHKILAQNGVSVPISFQATEENIEASIQLFGKIWLRARKGAGSKAALPITSLLQAQGWMDYWKAKGISEYGFMISEFLPGKEYAWQSLWHNGTLISSQARERVEYFAGNLAPSGQTSSPSVARTVTRDDLDQTGQAAVRAVSEKPHGVFCIDLKENSQGVPCVTEINAGRFFTTSNFFAHAGLNMPAMYLELGLTGELQDRPGLTDNLPDDLYWLRWIDCNFKLVDGKDI
jgi:carbamoyl-phosphate synthase large subunit